MSPLDRVLDSFTHVRKSGSGWTARCPAHDDRVNSLSISKGIDGRVLLFCHAGCSFQTILAACGLNYQDVGPEPFRQEAAAGRTRGPESPESEHPDAVYDYVDNAGSLLFQVCRFSNKRFRQRRSRPDRPDQFVWSLGDTPRVLYRLPLVLEAVAASRTIYIVEGEKDVHALEQVGVTATCNPGGAGKWRAEYCDTLRGAHVVVVADRDEPGYRHAAEVAEQLRRVGADVQVVEAAVGNDVSEHLAAARTLEELRPVRTA